MPKNILIDLNVILDVLLDREGSKASLSVLELGESPNYRLCISAHMVTTLAYLLEQAKVPRQTSISHLHWLLRTFTVARVDDIALKKALKSKLRDYEDAVVEQAAISCDSAAIITRNVKDFKSSTVPALTPELFITSNTPKSMQK